mmetsp:Transcript_158524/g.279895  ORF Transcript_158524/g.279895 Transcript_158524/m.279895 type:complete len:428 (-) Transcript_158524:102-1385(-)
MAASTAAPKVAVVGAGVAGLVCAKELEKAGIDIELFEAADRVGGRVQTDYYQGYKLDLGFQILLDAYPEARRHLDYSSLSLRCFAPGAVLAHAGQLKVVAHPLKYPWQLLGTFRTALAWGLMSSVMDVLRLLKLVVHWIFSSPYRQLETASKVQTTSALLKDLGLSNNMVNQFLRPFFEAIYVSPLQEQSSAMFNFVLRMLAFGGAALPERGMRAIPEYLASTLKGQIRLSTSVEEVRSSGVKVDGDWKSFDAVVVATAWPAASSMLALSPPRATRSATWYFALQSPPPVADPLIILQSYGKDDPCESELMRSRVVNIGFPSTVQPSYAPPGHALAAVTVMGMQAEEAWVRSQVESMLGMDCSSWQLLRKYDIGFHQPAQVPLQLPGDVATSVDGIFCCGDHRSYPTLDGAMLSGRLVAAAVAQQLV